ncbi:hypothetical protein MMC25_003156 [Agyrium rufum]|nr:hypothetical protein [Agyrium rufum]
MVSSIPDRGIITPNAQTTGNDVLISKDSTLDSDAIEKGLADLDTIKELAKVDTAFAIINYRCPSCKENRRKLELGDEKFLFGQVSVYRNEYMHSLEQAVRLLSRKFNREQRDDTEIPSTGPIGIVSASSTGATKDAIAEVKDVEGSIQNEITRMIAYEDGDGEVIETLPELEKPKGLTEKRKKTYAIEIIRPLRRTKTNGRYNHSQIPGGLMKLTINSLPLIEAFRKVAPHHPAGLLERDSMTLSEPFDFVVHNIDRLTRFQPVTADQSDFSIHLALLRGFVDDKYGEDIAAVKALYTQSPPRCTFRMLWHLFERGSDLVGKVNSEYRAFGVSECTDPKRQTKGGK